MGKSLKKIVYSIKEALEGYNITDDTVYSNEYIADKVKDVRSTMIIDEIRNNIVDDGNYSQYCCLEVQCQNKSCTINGQTITSDEIEYYVELPRLVPNTGWNNIKYFGLIDMKTPFSRKNVDGFLSLDGNKWTGKDPAYLVVDSHAYLANLPSSGIKFLCMIALLDDPIDECDWDEDDDYPVSDVFKLEMLVKKDILSTFGIRADVEQDSRDTTPTDTEVKTVQKGNK